MKKLDNLETIFKNIETRKNTSNLFKIFCNDFKINEVFRSLSDTAVNFQNLPFSNERCLDQSSGLKHLLILTHL